jgi:hypothetical protein
MHGKESYTLRTLLRRSAGRPVGVSDGRFDTFGSLVGLVPEVWFDKTVYIS